MYPYILKKFIHPVVQIKYPLIKHTTKYLRLLEKTQWWKLSEIERFQQQRLRALLDHAYKNVPYYHRLFKTADLKPADIKTSKDLQRVPILTKEIIRKNLNELTAKNYPSHKLIPSSTGGSTGEPTKFFIDIDWGAWNMAAAYREWNWAGYTHGDKMAYLWNAPHDISYQAKLKTKLYNTIQRIIYLDAEHLTEKQQDEYIKKLRKFKPTVINAYPSSIYLMARYMEKKNITYIRPHAILTSCEMLYDYQRKKIESIFGCDVFDYYSGRDTTFHAGECQEHMGYHMAIENAVIEFFRENEPVTSGEFGKIILTDLSNYAMPFIRYEIGDLGKPGNDQCSCGRGLPLMKEISGRINDIILTNDGKYISGLFFYDLFHDKKGGTKGVKQFQLIQKTKTYMILKIVKDDDFSDKEFEKIMKKIYEQCGDMKIDIEFVESIPPSSSGKYRPTISEVEINI